MAVLTSKLVISLVDQVAGPARSVRSALNDIHRAWEKPLGAGGISGLSRSVQREAERVRAAAAGFQSAMTSMSFGMGQLIQSTQDYQRAYYGVKASLIGDNIAKDGTIAFAAIGTAARAAKKDVDELSQALGMRPTGLMKAWEAIGKAGAPVAGMSPEDVKRSTRTLVHMGAETHRQDPDISPQQAAEILHTFGINFGAGKKEFERGQGSGDYSTDITKLTQQLIGISNLTKTSPSKLAAGLRQYAALYGGTGSTFAETAALMGAAVQGGLNEIEAGTALKSMIVRALKNFTAEGREAWMLAGLDRNDYMDLSQVSARKLGNDLITGAGQRLDKSQKDAIRDYFFDAETTGRNKSSEFFQESLQFYNDVLGAKDQQSKDRNADRLAMAMYSSGGRVQSFKLFGALASKLGALGEADQDKVLQRFGLSDLGDHAQGVVREKMKAGTLTQGQLAQIGEGRHLSRYNAILALMGTADDLERKARSWNSSEFTSAGRELAKDDPFWQWEQAMAGLERSMNNLRESKGVVAFIEGLSQLADLISSANPALVETAGWALAITAVGAPLGLALAAVVGPIVLFTMAVSRLGAVLAGTAALLGLRGVAGAGAAGAAGSAAATAAAAAAGGAGMVAARRFGWLGGAAKGVGMMVPMLGQGIAMQHLWSVGGAALKAGRFAVPGLGTLMALYTLGSAAYGGYQKYRETGSVLEGVKEGSGWNSAVGLAKALGLVGENGRGLTGHGGVSAPLQYIQQRRAALSGDTAAADMTSAGAAVADVKAGAAETPASVASAMSEAQSIVAAASGAMFAAGRSLASELAAGIRSGQGEIAAAAREAANAAVRNATRDAFSDGGMR